MICNPFRKVKAQQAGVWESCDAMLGGIKGVPVNLEFTSGEVGLVPKTDVRPVNRGKSLGRPVFKKPTFNKISTGAPEKDLAKKLGALNLNKVNKK